MRLSIGHRLFFAILLSFVLVAIGGIALVRWAVFAHGTSERTEATAESLAAAIDALRTQYRTHQGWSFLPPAPAARTAWLRETLAPVDTKSPTLGYRIGLLDRDRRELAGVFASRLLVTFASIDRVERPLVVDGATVGYVVVAKPLDPDDALGVAFLLQQQRNLSLLALTGVVLSAFAAALLAAHFRAPIRQLVDGARRLERGDFDTRLASQRRDELGELADTFDHLGARLAEAEQSRRQWVADTSHELRTPLSVLRAQLEAVQDGIRPASPEVVASLLRQVHALSALVDDLYTLARADVGALALQPVAFDAWQVLEQLVHERAQAFDAAGLAVTLAPAPAQTTVRGDAARIRQVLGNLLENSLRYTDAGGRVALSAEPTGETLRIAIDDSVPGVPPDALDRLGERFFRLDSSRNRALGGAGLGLALCRRLVALHGGELAFAPSPLGGLRVMLTLPLAT